MISVNIELLLGFVFLLLISFLFLHVLCAVRGAGSGPLFLPLELTLLPSRNVALCGERCPCVDVSPVGDRCPSTPERVEREARCPDGAFFPSSYCRCLSSSCRQRLLCADVTAAVPSPPARDLSRQPTVCLPQRHADASRLGPVIAPPFRHRPAVFFGRALSSVPLPVALSGTTFKNVENVGVLAARES